MDEDEGGFPPEENTSEHSRERNGRSPGGSTGFGLGGAQLLLSIVPTFTFIPFDFPPLNSR